MATVKKQLSISKKNYGFRVVRVRKWKLGLIKYLLLHPMTPRSAMET